MRHSACCEARRGTAAVEQYGGGGAVPAKLWQDTRGFLRTLGGPWSSIISTHLRPIIILSLFFRQKTACPRDIFDDDAAAAAIDIDAATYEAEETTTTTDNIETTCVQEGGGGGVVPRGNCVPDPVSTPIDVSGHFFSRPDD